METHSSTGSFNRALSRFEQEHFKTKSKYGNTSLYIKAIICMSMVACSYLAIMLGTFSHTVLIILCVSLAIGIALVGFNVMHDASHLSFFKNKEHNILLSQFLDHIHGAFFANWRTKHVYMHHTNPNVDGEDDDIATGNLLMLHPHNQWKPIHRYQHIYAFFLYTLLYFTWVFYADFKKFYSRKILNRDMEKSTRREIISFYTSKLSYGVLYIALPLMKFSFVEWLVGFLIFGGTIGLVLSIVFQLAHVNTYCAFTTLEERGFDIKAHQVRSTVDFATQNKVVTSLLGGLNFQVIHHLFPGVSHVHYPKMQQEVSRIIEEYNLIYRDLSLSEAFISHLQYLKKMGTLQNIP